MGGYKFINLKGHSMPLDANHKISKILQDLSRIDSELYDIQPTANVKIIKLSSVNC
jgi:hypothetical protein